MPLHMTSEKAAIGGLSRIYGLQEDVRLFYYNSVQMDEQSDQ